MKKRLKGLRKKALCFGLSLAVMLGLGVWAAAPVMAADEAYDYTIRIYSGAQGTYNGEQTIKANYGDKISFYPQKNTTVTDEKYYVKGIREAGLDNNEAVEESTITVTEDVDYVIAYGIKDKTVSYTINYVDAAGNTLEDSETYYGNIGDKPVIAFLYIEGYQPQAYNLTKTLSENEGENQFTFVYTANPTETTTTVTTTTTTTTTVAGTGTGGTGGTGTAGTAAGGTGTGGVAGGAGGAGTGTGDAGTTGPADIVDLDDQDVPLAGVNDGNGGNGDDNSAVGEETINNEKPPLGKLSTAAKAAIGVIIAAAIIVLIIALAMRARKRKNEEET
ncbi:MAG: hypothetical protein E7236_00680 [Lachnospiraceae bacterium]|nr:hypothetical protein [Lachnospiraceae bacterium]